MTTIALAILLLLINAIALLRIAGARQEAERVARAQHEATTTLDARAVAAACGSLRADFLFLANGLAQIGVPVRLADENAFVARWTRLDAEGRILVFLQAHREVERLVVTDAAGNPVVVTGRRGGAPILLPPATGTDVSAGSRRAKPFRWPIGSGAEPDAWLDAWVDPDRLLARAVPGATERGVRVVTEPGEVDARSDSEELRSVVAVTDTTWSPPVRWELVHESDVARALESVREVSDQYRRTVLFNAALLGLASIAAALMFREVRRVAQADAEQRHQARLRDVESNLRHSERLASLGRMAAGIAHEINNPLEGMANYLAMAEQDLAARDFDAARHNLGRVRAGLDRIAQIVRRVLRLASPGRGLGHTVDLNEIVSSAIELARGTPAGKGRNVTLRADGSPRVLGDPTTLGQLVLNLLINAMEADTNGKDIDVETIDGQDHAEVRVLDRGPGLPPDQRDRLFEPFWSTKGSTGLGLAIAHGIAVDHGGSLRAEDRAGGGAIFVLRVPRNARPTDLRGVLRGEANA